MICSDKNDDCYHKGREGGGRRVMIVVEITLFYKNKASKVKMMITMESPLPHICRPVHEKR